MRRAGGLREGRPGRQDREADRGRDRPGQRAAAERAAASRSPIAEDLCRRAADPADRRSLDAWSGTAGASARTLARLFERDLGISFGEWRRRLRFHRAVEQLSGGASIARVAQACGYRSPSAFSAAFHSFVGTPPSRFSTSDDQARSPTTVSRPNRGNPAA
ncbi:helix-turn-helix domain-containing protein [Thermohalobaculum sediminis]|uniref:helix-turn-helix domain-containing protein n=1 Tax=Thermohalobaculum sediminis TaxID=2939436 RepID=UPI003873532F